MYPAVQLVFSLSPFPRREQEALEEEAYTIDLRKLSLCSLSHPPIPALGGQKLSYSCSGSCTHHPLFAKYRQGRFLGHTPLV